jgi:DNA-binding response OmpR family regulator
MTNALTAAAHIVVCDDEPDIRDTVAEYLAEHGYAVTPAGSGPALREIVGSHPVDIVILDIRMPGEDGLSVARYLREHSDVAIIMLTGSAEIVDRVVGLEVGADDYVTKPVDLRELLARVKAVLRRTAGTARSLEQAGASGGEPVRFGSCRLDLEQHKLFDAEGSEVPITAMEFRLLKVFAEHRGRILNRDQLLELAHDRGWDPFDRSIDIRISRLRKKIEADPSKPEVIKTVRGVGYIYS